MQFLSLYASLRGMSAYHGLKQEPIMKQAIQLVGELGARRGGAALDAYTELFYRLRKAGFTGLGEWLSDHLRYTETPYAVLAERNGSDPALENAARRELDILVELSCLDCDVYINAMRELLGEEYEQALASLPRWRAWAPFDFDSLTWFYRENGCGLYAKYRAFLWEDGKLIPVDDPDCPRPEDLLGYELQRNQVEANTRHMMEGHRTNNVLLFGDGGTGKSAAVKSMLYLPGMDDLRLIEIQKENITGLPTLIRSLSGLRHKFILFIDDLAFDQDDKAYSSMKTILEGSLEKRPANVAIYATSNRRHLVRQTFTERAGEEVDTFETISEKTALAERFGLRIAYLTMNKMSYLDLVDYLAVRAGITMPMAELHAQAMKWEIRHAGRTPRVAQQFIASLNEYSINERS